MRKVYLMTPGPTPVPDLVRLAGAQEIIHHRTKEYFEVFKNVSENLKPIFKTKNPVLTFTSSGTGAMEGAVVNTLSRDDKVLVILGGRFSERWVKICKAYGLEVTSIDTEWGDVVKPSMLKKLLDKKPQIKAVFATLCETSTATVYPIKEYGEIIKKKPNTLFIVDAVSGLSSCDIQVDNWGVDVCVSASQKALMLPPGLSFVSVSKKAWRFIEKSNLPKFYFDFNKALGCVKGTISFTPAVSLVLSAKCALQMINEEGIDNILARVATFGEAMRAAAKALGLKLISKYPANAVTGIFAPEGISGLELKSVLDKKYGILVAGGQDKFEGKIIRITHLGYISQFDIITVISGLELALKDLGYPVKLGEGVRAAQEVFGRI